TFFCSSSMPASAARMRRVPSNRNGLVTTPAVRLPLLRAVSAITGAAPVPVPPPMPAARNTMLQPSSARSISSTVSSAAARPTSGREPAPRPRVMSGPSWMRCSAIELLSAWASVLATMKSTPSISAWIMLATALPPAPPTPMTAIRGRSSSTEGGPMLMLIRCSPRGGVGIPGLLACAIKRIAGAKGKWSYPQAPRVSEILLHRRPHPQQQPDSGGAMGLPVPRADGAAADRSRGSEEHAPGQRGETGHAVGFGQALERRRTADPARLAERRLGIVGEPGELRASAGEHDLPARPARLPARVPLRFERAADLADQPVE